MNDRKVSIQHTGGFHSDVRLSDSSFISTAINAVETFDVTFISEKFVIVERGDFFVFNGSKYVFCEPLNVEEKHSGHFEFRGKAVVRCGAIKNLAFLFLDTNANQTAIYQTRGDFSVTATIGELVGIIKSNIKRAGFKEVEFLISNEIDKAELRTITFNNAICLDALKTICNEFSAEFSTDGDGAFVIGRNLTRGGSELILSYPLNLLSPISIEAKDTNETCTHLFVFGSDKNLPQGYNDGKGSRLLMSGKREYISRAELPQIRKEAVKVFDDVFPRRKGRISAVEEKNGIYYITDTSLEFDINEYLSANTAKVSFLSGYLIGKEIEIASYSHGTKTMELRQQNDGDVAIPNATMKPRVGDEYTLIDIRLPEEYVTKAEEELTNVAEKYFAENCGDKIRAKVEVSAVWLMSNSREIREGQMVRLYDANMGVNRLIRVTEVKRYPVEGSSFGRKIEVTLSDYVKVSRLDAMSNNITAVGNGVKKSITNITNTTTTNITNNIGAEALKWDIG